MFLLYLLYLPFSGYSELVFDAGKYWTLTERFFRYSRFQLLAYDDSLRGYLLALLNLPAKALVHFTGVAPLVFTRVMGAANAALLFGWAGPALWRALFPAAALSKASRAAFVALGFLFWRDYFNFPLSDFPAVLAMATSLWLIVRRKAFGPLLLAGALLAAAVNIRPVYLVAAPLVMVLTITQAAATWSARWRGVAALALGFTCLSAPQLLINARHYQRPTPLVLARDARFPAANLYLSQLGWGVVVQKYETTLDAAFPAPRMLYVDPAGQRLLRQQALRHFPDYATYLRALARQPLEFAALYGRHLFNGLDVQYASPYIRQVGGRQAGLALLHYSVWFGALLALAHWRRPIRWPHLLVAGALLAPALVTLPMAIECRFLLPLHLLLYAAFCFGALPNYDAVRAWSGWKRGLVAAAYGLFLLICVTLSAQTRNYLTADLSVLRPLGSAAR
ncbi:hypothetical protein [Hymenobacter daecheongensis]|uniref:hypothetical protein n=1 Tax=Hymenobacter daecheongensis TaxID=496053 RepID=UPI001161501B|nr:hypothetical protein [Hymenobacter daecheongensis]